ncbi:MAG: DUF4139 domain-containing protein [Myxococcales bacterium]|nr:DUF4139 domain-containing protein [Myxococcales bacterium]MCB9751123.1 DUF4139 domain-containing protein [Myxococcales bacterium]
MTAAPARPPRRRALALAYLTAASLSLPALLLCELGCAHGRRVATTDAEGLGLTRVVLYRNGIGYFERHGEVDGDVLHLKVRKDQVNDLLKSLTVVDRKTGKAVSVSMPLDASTWANAALASLEPGHGNLAQVLDALRGAEVTLRADRRRVTGRVVMVEAVINEPSPEPASKGRGVSFPMPTTRDHKVTLLSGQTMNVVRLSRVKAVTLREGDLAMHIHRRLDASAGEGMFQQVSVDVRLAGARSHELVVSYVVAAPMWKPTYRVVLPDAGKGAALLQAWAVVDNISGEDWNDVGMSLTSGAPIAFRYDLHTPREVGRADLTESGVARQARVALGETTYRDDDDEVMTEGDEEREALALEDSRRVAEEQVMREKKKTSARARPKPSAQPAPPPGVGSAASGAVTRGWADKTDEPEEPMLDLESLRASTQASARAKQVSGLTQFDLADRVTVPNGTSTMVALVNDTVDAEQTFLFRPGGAGPGFEQNPYRVVRFRNTTPFVLEPGPISIYAGGSFVGEGLSEAVGSDTSATIPFAVEPEIAVTRATRHSGDEMKLTRIVRGVLEVQSFNQTTTAWTVAGKRAGGYTVLVRHPRAGADYTLRERPPGTEDLVGAYLIPITVPASATEAALEVVEQTPSRTSVTIWDDRAIRLIELALQVPELDARARQQLEPILARRRELGKIDTTINGLKQQQRELDQRAQETRANLEAIKKDPRATALRAKLSKRLEEFTREADELGRKIVELSSQRLEQRIEIEDMIQELDLRTPPGAAATPAATEK